MRKFENNNNKKNLNLQTIKKNFKNQNFFYFKNEERKKNLKT